MLTHKWGHDLSGPTQILMLLICGIIFDNALILISDMMGNKD